MDEKVGAKSLIKEQLWQAQTHLRHYEDEILSQFVSSIPSSFITDIPEARDDIGKQVLTRKSYSFIGRSFFEYVYANVTRALLKNLSLEEIPDKNKFIIQDYLCSFRYNGEEYHVYLIDNEQMVQVLSTDIPDDFEEDEFDSSWEYEYISSEELLMAADFASRFSKAAPTHIILVFVDVTQNDRWISFSESSINEQKLSYKGAISSVAGDDFKAIFDSLELMPYDKFLSMFYNAKTVDFLRRKQKDLDYIYQDFIEQNNRGVLADHHRSEIVTRFLLASNNFVGTEYSTPELLEYKFSNNRLFFYDNTTPPYSQPQYSALFKRIAMRASANTSYLMTDDVYQSLVSSEWMFNNIGSTAMFDNTYICFGYFKMVEILLSEILVKEYSGCTMSKNAEGALLTISPREKNSMMLGNMKKFILHSSDSKLQQCPEGQLVEDLFSLWLKETRNGYFHKDSISNDDVVNIRNITFELVYMILGTLPRSEILSDDFFDGVDAAKIGDWGKRRLAFLRKNK